MTYLARTNEALPITSANQATYQDGSSNLRPNSYNESYSGGSKKATFSSATTQTLVSVPCRACRLVFPGTAGTPGNVTLYDSSSGATGTVIFGPTTPSAGQIIDLQIPCDNGVVCVTASATVGFLTYDQV